MSKLLKNGARITVGAAVAIAFGVLLEQLWLTKAEAAFWTLIVGLLVLALLYRGELRLPQASQWILTRGAKHPMSTFLIIILIGGGLGASLFGGSWFWMIYEYKKNPPLLPPSPPSSIPSKPSTERPPTAAEIAEEVAKKLPGASKPKSQPLREPDPNLELLPKIAEDVGEIKKQTAPETPRRLSHAQRAAMLEVLRKYQGFPIEIATVLQDNEADDYAQDFVAIFREAGWNLGGPRGYSSTLWSRSPIGLQLWFRSNEAQPPSLGPVVTALRAAGLEPEGILQPQLRADQVQLIIGEKH